MIRIGLSSTALLTASPQEVIAAAKAAGIDAIEWAGGVHVPHDDASAARSIMIDTLRAGLTTASYAALYRVDGDGELGLRFDALLEAAADLGAPMLRVFVGERASGGRARVQRVRLVEEAKRLGDRAAERGLTLCLSFGRNSYLDRYEDGVSLAGKIDHPFVRFAWEELSGSAPRQCAQSLEAAGRAVGMLLVRHMGKDGMAAPLEREEAEWRQRLGAFKKVELDPKMGQFVVIAAIRDRPPEDAAAALPGLAEDVAFLRRLAAEIEKGS